jgi:hypothetical protein
MPDNPPNPIILQPWQVEFVKQMLEAYDKATAKGKPFVVYIDSPSMWRGKLNYEELPPQIIERVPKPSIIESKDE